MGVLQCKGCDNNALKHWWDYESWHREGWTFLTSINEIILVCINILLSISLQHHPSLWKRVAAFHNCSFTAVTTYLPLWVVYPHFMFKKHNIVFLTFFLKNEYSRNIMGQDHEFWITESVKEHFKKQCNRYNQKPFIGVTAGHVACMRDRESALRVLVGGTWGKETTLKT